MAEDTRLDSVSSVPLTGLLAGRRSPRSFDQDHAVGDEELVSLLEAARWAPSSHNGQPSRFAVGRRGTARFAAITEALADKNLLWAPRSSALLVGLLVRRDAKGRPMKFAEYDLGQAVAHITVQAESMGLKMRQIGGFDAGALRNALNLQEGVEPFIVAAIGRQASADLLDGELAARERAPRGRMPFNELVLDWE